MNSTQLAAFLDSPAAIVPLGQTQNFDAYSPAWSHGIINAAFGLTLSTVALFMRLYTRRFLIRVISWEDYTAVTAWLLLIVYTVNKFLYLRYIGTHTWNYRMKDLFDLLYYANLGQCLYGPTILMVKLSILLQYKRIFVPSDQLNRSMSVAIIVTIFTCIVFYTAHTFLQIFSCLPREFVWNKLRQGGGHCLNIGALTVASAGINVFTDFVILCLPFAGLWNLRMENRKKLGVLAVFGVGFLACSASIARLYYSIQLSVTGDLSYYMLGACLWAYAEIWIGLLCCCLPVLPKFVKIVGPRLSQTLTSKYTLGTSKGSTIHSTGPYRSVLSDSKVDSGRADDDIEMGGWQPGNARGTFSVDIEGNYSQSDLEPCVKNGRIMQTVQIEIENAGTKSPKPSRYTFLRD